MKSNLLLIIADFLRILMMLSAGLSAEKTCLWQDKQRLHMLTLRLEELIYEKQLYYFRYKT